VLGFTQIEKNDKNKYLHNKTTIALCHLAVLKFSLDFVKRFLSSESQPSESIGFRPNCNSLTRHDCWSCNCWSCFWGQNLYRTNVNVNPVVFLAAS